MMTETSENDLVRVNLFSIQSEDKTVIISSNSDKKSITYEGTDEVYDSIGWIPVVSGSEALPNKCGRHAGDSRIFIYKDSEERYYLVLDYSTNSGSISYDSKNIADSIPYTSLSLTSESKVKWESNPSTVLLPLAPNGKNPLQIKLNNGELYSLELSNIADINYTGESGKYNMGYVKALHIGVGTKDYVACSTCKVTCDLGCSNDSISEIQNACAVFGICTSNCLGVCKTTCMGGSTGTGSWWDCKSFKIGSPEADHCNGYLGFGFGFGLSFGGMYWELYPNCYLTCGMTCNAVCDTIDYDYKFNNNDGPNIFSKTVNQRSKSNIETSKGMPRKYLASESKYGDYLTQGTMCKNSCEGSCYMWCNLGCDTSCLYDNNCSYFAESTMPKPSQTDDAKAKSIKNQKDYPCKWCKFTRLLFPI